MLVLLDEVTNNKSMRILAHSFHIYIRKELDIFILMTGLYENIYQLQINFDIDQKSAKEMADETKGYAFAYQVLGYVKWRNPEKSLKQILPEYEQYLEEYVYQKIWSELSDTDRNVLFAFEGKEEMKIKHLRDKINMSSSLFSTYRDRLDKKGLIDTSKYGFIGLLLPRFSNFVEKQR